MECKECRQSETSPGIYRIQCLQCCVRLVVSARPSRRQQEAILAAIARFPGAPDIHAVLAAMPPLPKQFQRNENHTQERS